MTAHTIPRQRRYESPDLVAMLGRMSRALVRRAGEGDLEAVTALRDARAFFDAALVDAARAAHDGPFGYTWGEIGRELSITRQGARQRFADAGDDEPRQLDAGDLFSALGGVGVARVASPTGGSPAGE